MPRRPLIQAALLIVETIIKAARRIAGSKAGRREGEAMMEAVSDQFAHVDEVI